MLRKIGRLFTIKTRFEAWAVIYAITLGAIERGQHYMVQYPGFGGMLLALACTGVVFVAGGKLLDSVRPVEVVAGAQPHRAGPRRMLERRAPIRRRSRPTHQPRRRA